MWWSCTNIVLKLIEVGGPELLMDKNENEDIALHYGYFRPNPDTSYNYSDVFALVVKECILANIGGEFGIGGLFNVARQEVQSIIYQEWEEFSPALKSTMESLQEDQPLILHAAIVAKAPSHVICNIIYRSKYNVHKTDHLGRYPIEVAFQKGLDWSEGLQQIVETTAVEEQQHPRIIYSAAKYGLEWRHYMKELAGANGEEIMNGYDSVTGLRLFMVAAMGNNNDLSTIYAMMKMGPETSIEL